jgi:nucleoside-diphosphate-sugar epimerase
MAQPIVSHNANILVTGVTGLIGGEVVRRLLRLQTGDIYCLIRPGARGDARVRLLERLHLSEDAGAAAARCLRPIAGDVAQPRFGLSDVDFDRVSRSVDVVVHCASELSFIRDAHCRETNITGMHNLIGLVRSCVRKPNVVHLSTVASCGAVTHQCLSEEDGSDPENEHHNEYTRTKAVAESVLRSADLPYVVIRPSITLSAGLRARKFARAIAWFVPLLQDFEAMPIDPASRVDIVPVSFVAEAIVRLLRKPTGLRWECYNVSSGPQAATLCGRACAFLDGFYERSKTLTLISPSQWTREMHRRYVDTPHRRKLFSTLRYYLPFLNMDVVYDNSRLRAELGSDFPEVTPVTEYMGELLNLISGGEATDVVADLQPSSP